MRLASAAELSKASAIGTGVLWSPSSWSEIVAHDARFPTWGLARKGRFYAADIEQFSDTLPPVLLKDVLQPFEEVGHDFDFTESTVDRLKASTPVNKYVGGVEILSNQGGGARMGYTVFGVNGVAPTLTSTQSRHYERYKIGKRYRRLTNVEYARIQGFADDHCSVVSPYSQYTLFGNAVPPRMAAWAVGRALSEGESIRERMVGSQQQDLFANAG